MSSLLYDGCPCVIQNTYTLRSIRTDTFFASLMLGERFPGLFLSFVTALVRYAMPRMAPILTSSSPRGVRVGQVALRGVRSRPGVSNP